jgi:hypothetical protein
LLSQVSTAGSSVQEDRLGAFIQDDSIPVQMLYLSNQAVRAEFLKKFNPINNRQNVVVVPSSGRAAAQAVLREHGAYGHN